MVAHFGETSLAVEPEMAEPEEGELGKINVLDYKTVCNEEGISAAVTLVKAVILTKESKASDEPEAEEAAAFV